MAGVLERTLKLRYLPVRVGSGTLTLVVVVARWRIHDVDTAVVLVGSEPVRGGSIVCVNYVPYYRPLYR